MDLPELKKRLTEIESELDSGAFVSFATVPTPGGDLRVVVTDRLRKACRKGKIWKSPAMLTALKNAQYGLDRNRSRSRGGSDGIFLLDRTFHPPNEMMRKLFDRFLDKPDPLVALLMSRLKVRLDDLIPVRVVSHHMRLLGVLVERPEATLVLVDYDDTKDA
jgi:hypothetical protein